MGRRRAGTVLIRAQARGAGHAAADFTRAQRQVQDVTIRELRNLGVRGVAILQDHALEDTGELKRGLRFVPFFRAANPQVTFVSEAERDGYPYTAVTRFGHRMSVIRPRQASALAVHGPRRESIEAWASFVRGFGHAERQPVDWVETAMPQIDREADRAADRIAAAVGVNMLPAHRVR